MSRKTLRPAILLATLAALHASGAPPGRADWPNEWPPESMQFRRSCNAQYILHADGVQVSFPSGFTVTASCNIDPNECRRRASSQAHRCMNEAWERRWIRNQTPPECTETTPHVTETIHYPVRDLKDAIERAACCGSAPWRNQTSKTLALHRRTWGDKGCGTTGIRTVHSHFIHTYVVNCPAIRERFGC